MKIQKISSNTGISHTGSAKKAKSNTATSSVDAGQISKNNFLSGISFKGYTDIQIKSRSEYEAGTSGALYVSSSDVEHPPYTSVTSGNAGYDVQENTYARYKVYMADPGEKITDKIRNKHKFVVEYDRKPDDISRKDIEREETASALKKMVNDLKITVAILEREVQAADKKLKADDEAVLRAEEVYEKAKKTRDDSQAQKADKDYELSDSRDKLKIASTKYETVAERERAEYMAAERKRKLAEIQEKMNNVTSSAQEQIRQIEESKKAELEVLEKLKKELLGE